MQKKQETKAKASMPKDYVRFKDMIIWRDTDNWIKSDVLVGKDGHSLGQERAANHKYYSSLSRLIESMGDEIASKGFPDFVKIRSDIQELNNLITKGLLIKYETIN